RYALIGYPGKRLGWIFARDPEMSDDRYRELLQRLDAQGYDTSRLLRIAQRPEQIGAPGFQ
ncbi:lipocalin family protein, partial [Acinetobacter baumannii]